MLEFSQAVSLDKFEQEAPCQLTLAALQPFSGNRQSVLDSFMINTICPKSVRLTENIGKYVHPAGLKFVELQYAFSTFSSPEDVQQSCLVSMKPSLIVTHDSQRFPKKSLCSSTSERWSWTLHERRFPRYLRLVLTICLPEHHMHRMT